MDKMENKTNSAMPVLIDLVAMYVITGLLLVILAALLGRLELSDAAVSIGIIATYIISCFAGGFFIGKKKKKEKISLGIVRGSVLFCSAAAGESGGQPGTGRADRAFADDSCFMRFVRYGGRNA